MTAQVPVKSGLRGGRGNPPGIGRFDLELAAFQIIDVPSIRLYLYTPADVQRETKLQVTAAATTASP
jgi:hypothetical protein